MHKWFWALARALMDLHWTIFFTSNKSTQYAMKVPKRAQVSSIAIELRKIEPIVTYHLIDNSLKSLAYEGTTFCRCAVNDFIRY